MKIDLRGVSETLLVTLYMRAKDAKSNHPFLNDQKAAEIISRMDYDFPLLTGYGCHIMEYWHGQS